MLSSPARDGCLGQTGRRLRGGLSGRDAGMLRAVAGLAVLLSSALLASTAHAYVYWSDYGGFTGGGTTLGRANIDGSAVDSSFITGASNPGGLAVDADHLYWSEGGGAIARATVGGDGVDEAFLPGSATGGSVVAIAVDSSYIYWTDGSRYIGRARLDGTAVSSRFIDMGAGTYPAGIAISGGTLYVGEAGQIARVAATGGPPTTFVTLAGGTVSPLGLTAVAGYVYWTEVDTGASPPVASIGRVAVSGVGADPAFIPGLKLPEGIASDGTYIYWVDNSTHAIGRAKLDGSQVNMSVITDPGGPSGLAIDPRVDPTATSLTCTPGTVALGGVSACTAKVGDSASSEPPSGTVVFSGDSGTFFPGGNSCTLTVQPAGGASCTVGAEPTTTGSQTASAAYQGDATHAASSSSGSFCAGGSAICGGQTSGSPGASGGSGRRPVRCKVPRLKGRTLSQARKLLTVGHCRLGRVTSPRPKSHHRPALLVVRSQSRAPGRMLAAATRVSLRLAAKPTRRPHPHR